jgi:hypothetical protein
MTEGTFGDVRLFPRRGASLTARRAKFQLTSDTSLTAAVKGQWDREGLHHAGLNKVCNPLATGYDDKEAQRYPRLNQRRQTGRGNNDQH